MQKNHAIKKSHTKKNICKKRYAFEFFRHTVCVERNERTDDLSSAGNTGLPAGRKPHFQSASGTTLAPMTDAQANLHDSAKNGRNVDKKEIQKKRPVSAKCMN